MSQDMKKPNFLGIGATKSGTSSLRYYLKQHPEVYIPDAEKEPGYFCHGGNNDNIFFRVKSEREYLALFEDAGDAKAVGEITPHYLDSPHAAQNIKAEIPDAKLIVSIRNPIERSFSIYQMNLRNKNHNRDVPFETALENDIWTKNPYYENLRTFYTVFPREQILLVLFEDLAKDPVALSRSVFGFLGVDASFVPDVSKVVNPGGLPRSRLLHAVLNSRRARRMGRRVVPKSVQDRLERVKNANLQKQGMTPAQKEKARGVFRDDILRTQDLIGMDLSRWLTA